MTIINSEEGAEGPGSRSMSRFLYVHYYRDAVFVIVAVDTLVGVCTE